MVARNYYDVIVIGTQLGPLLVAALLARRGFRVLVIAHDDLPGVYSWEGHRLRQEPFTVAGADSPAVRRVLSELSLTQMFRRRTTPHEPFYQIVLPKHRLDVTGDQEAFSRELDREFPDAHRAIEGFYAVVDRCNQELDKLMGNDIVLPPEGFFEKRELARALVHDPFAQARGPFDLFGELPEDHPFRAAVLGQVRWASELDAAETSPVQVVRLHSAWARGTLAIDGGLEGLKELILDRIATHSGEVRQDLRAERIAFRRGRVAGVRMVGQDEVTGCNFVVLGADVHHLRHLAGDQDFGRRFSHRLANVQPAYCRFTLNLVVESAVVPAGMAANVIFISDLSRPLSEENLLRIEVTGSPDDPVRTLCVGALLDATRIEEPAFLGSIRGRIVDRVRWLVPFLDRHLLAVDSPHDGLPLRDVRKDADVVLADKSARNPSRMPTVCRVEPPGPLGVTGIPHRTGVKNLLVAARQVAPGLGIEGEFLTALGVARIVTRADRSKRKLRRETFTKIDV